ncbi:MAG: ATP-binding protein, partial [Chromatiales bacterium]
HAHHLYLRFMPYFNPITHVEQRGTKNNGLLSIPLVTEGRTIGALVAGIEQVDWNRIESHLMLVSTFADGAAKSIQQQLTIIRSEEERIEEARSEFQLHARKIIHEANNPLGIINNYLHILGTKLGEDHAAHEELRIIKDEIERVGKIILRLRDMPSDIGLEQGFVDLNSLILDVEKIFHTSLFVTHDISAQLDLETSLPPVAGSRNTLKQILTNLIKNSVEAMSDGGKITLITKDKINMNGKHYVGIEIIDNGPGIPDEIMENIFSPVKSTKGAGNAGLGLTIVKNLINELSGSISCTSSHEKGTTFQILLPRRIPMGDT